MGFKECFRPKPESPRHQQISEQVPVDGDQLKVIFDQKKFEVSRSVFLAKAALLPEGFKRRKWELYAESAGFSAQAAGENGLKRDRLNYLAKWAKFSGKGQGYRAQGLIEQAEFAEESAKEEKARADYCKTEQAAQGIWS